MKPHYEASGIRICRVPVKDEVPALREKLPECVRALDRLLQAGCTVYVHCTAGVGRSATVAAAYLHRCWGWDVDLALEYIKEKRPPATPSSEAIREAAWSNATASGGSG